MEKRLPTNDKQDPLPNVSSRLGPKKKLTPADVDNDAFWADFLNRPDAEAKYAAEQKLQQKKREWLEEREKIEERAAIRKQIAHALQVATAEVKKLIEPIFHIRIVLDYLWQVYGENEMNDKVFVETLRTDPKVRSEVLTFRENFQAGGMARMEDLEKQMKAINDSIAAEEAKKIQKNIEPQKIDVHTLRDLLEYAQQCRLEGNAKHREGLYEEALFIYSQGDEAMKQWKVESSMKNEHKWLKDNHLACLKNKSQAALNLELFQTALEAADAALELDVEDHKAWYRKLQAQKGLGNFIAAEESLSRLEDIAQWCPDRRQILRDCDEERKKLRYAKAKNKANTQHMLEKAFDAGIFSIDRERELEEATKCLEPPQRKVVPKINDAKKAAPKMLNNPAVEKPLEKRITLTAALAGDLMDELAAAYSQKWFQNRVQKCARDSGFEHSVFRMRLKDIAFQAQKPVLEKWGFDGTEQGVREMTAAIDDLAATGKEMPQWLKAKQEKCLHLLYGGEESGMLDLISR